MAYQHSFINRTRVANLYSTMAKSYNSFPNKVNWIDVIIQTGKGTSYTRKRVNIYLDKFIEANAYIQLEHRIDICTFFLMNI